MNKLSLLLSFFVILIMMSASAVTALSVSNGASIVPPRPYDYVLVIMMENQSINQTYNCGVECDAFLTPYANSHALALNYKAVVNGSLPNYFALTGGFTDDYNGQAVGCYPFQYLNTSKVCLQNRTNIVDSLEKANLKWKAYMEDYPPVQADGTSCLSGGPCSPGGCWWGNPDFNFFPMEPGDYEVTHNPFVYYQDVYTNHARCSLVVRANTNRAIGTFQTDDVLLNDLSSVSTAPNYMWLSPNTCDQMHHSCNWPLATDTVMQGSEYLSNLMPQIFNTQVFRTGKMAVFVTFDECTNATASVCVGTNRIYSVFAGGGIKANFKTNNAYDHYSFLHTLEQTYGLPYLTSNDSGAASMREFYS